MTKYKVKYRLINDYWITVEAKNEDNAKEQVELKADPNNQYDWLEIGKPIEVNND